MRRAAAIAPISFGASVWPFALTSFPRSVKVKRGEMVIFSWIVYKSRASRPRQRQGDADPRLADMMEMKDAPFDPKRMIYRGFNVVVDV